VTQTITLINAQGAWQSADFRLTSLKDGSVTNDYSAKQVCFSCRDGSALVSYAGIGSVILQRGTRQEEVEVSEWMRALLRGESLTVDATLIRLREAATLDLAGLFFRSGKPHMFSVAIFLGGTPWIAQIRNFSVLPSLEMGELLPHFETDAIRGQSSGGAIAAWPPLAKNSRDLGLLCRVRGKRPANPQHFSRLLADINSRVSEQNNLVSSHCVVTHMPPSGAPLSINLFRMPAGSPVVTTPHILFGLDVTETFTGMFESMRARKAGKDAPPAKPPQVTPKNLLK
jgi:hypothetical protein